MTSGEKNKLIPKKARWVNIRRVRSKRGWVEWRVRVRLVRIVEWDEWLPVIVYGKFEGLRGDLLEDLPGLGVYLEEYKEEN